MGVMGLKTNTKNKMLTEKEKHLLREKWAYGCTYGCTA